MPSNNKAIALTLLIKSTHALILPTPQHPCLTLSATQKLLPFLYQKLLRPILRQ